MHYYNYKIFFFLLNTLLLLLNLNEEPIDRIVHEDFLKGKLQDSTERKIIKLAPSKSLNLSGEINVHQPYLLTSNKESITIFDKQNFGFYQFNHSLANSNRFGIEGRGPGENIHPMSLGNDGLGNLWISDNNNLRVDKRNSFGSYIDSYRLPSGTIPYRFHPIDSETFIFFSIISKQAFFILDNEMKITHSFLEVDNISGQRQGFLLDGEITYNDETIYYAGRRNGLIKAYTKNGDLLYSRMMIETSEVDFINMEPGEIRSSPAAMRDFAVHNERIFILADGYLDTYDKNTGDYLYTYLVEDYAYRISFPDENQSKYFVLSINNATNDAMLSTYVLPD